MTAALLAACLSSGDLPPGVTRYGSTRYAFGTPWAAGHPQFQFGHPVRLPHGGAAASVEDG